MYPVENCADRMMSSRGTVKWPRRGGAMISEPSDELDIQPGHRVLEITNGPAETGPYDRILVTRVRWEWTEQLAPAGCSRSTSWWPEHPAATSFCAANRIGSPATSARCGERARCTPAPDGSGRAA